ncbi:Type I restriction modification DNA specificity domain family protein [Helicobacter bizzozeronii]|uniref:restriction endonuclease subunit S n=1 Tax=Helicobacter bizzozeronii TaxID=56877 RepID=UPI00244D9631|nr:restriction endonuclease subunit S [Helicobacter bizzozeronii]GMB93367.1 Type I restriction modification DNA specificity domain family protein [Helicobacter bizzozeronii]
MQALEWRGVQIGEVFEVFKPAKHNHQKRFLPTEPTKGHIPAITCTTQNNGIACYMPKEGAEVLENMISVGANGDAPAFYQPREFVLLQDCYALKFKERELNRAQYLFLVVCLNKVLAKYNWNNKSGWAKVSQEQILLPHTPDDKIAFEAMEAFIKELQAERLEELQAYLKVTGLEDAMLTPEEENALSIFSAHFENRGGGGGERVSPP